jgi:hypothetical protein
MPRPRVQLEDRQRVSKACIPCRASKKRCDSNIPCSSCIRRDCELVCIESHRVPLPGADRATLASSGRRQTIGQRSRDNTIRPVRSSFLEVEEHSSLRQTQLPRPLPNIAPASTLSPGRGLLGRQYDDDADECDMNMPAEDNGGSESSLREPSSLPRSRLMLSANGEKGKHYLEKDRISC